MRAQRLNPAASTWLLILSCVHGFASCQEASSSGNAGTPSSGGAAAAGADARTGGTPGGGSSPPNASGGATNPAEGAGRGGTGDIDTSAAGDGGATSNGGTTSDGGATNDGGTTSDGTGGFASHSTLLPCDIYASEATPCVAAYSTVRALSIMYSGPLYQVRRADQKTADIGVLGPEGFANAADQDAFCGDAACTISVLYDQSGRGNHLTRAPASCYLAGGPASEPSNESNANGRLLTVGGHRVYALYMSPHEAYRDNAANGMPKGTDSQGIYELVDGKRYDSHCCWDFGNASTDNCYSTTGQPNSLFFGTAYWGKGAGDGPWFMADFESGVWSGGTGKSSAINSDNPSIDYDYALGILKTTAATYAIRVGNAQLGKLVTAYDGALPFAPRAMMGGIVLGTSSDRSDESMGTFFEGAITSGRPSDAADEAVLEQIRAAGYGR